MSNQRGFSLLEMLVSTTVFLLILIGIYSLFDQGRWVHLAGEKRANMQGNARQIIELMERDLLLAGYGLPRAGEISGTIVTKWEPAIFNFTSKSVGFTGDIDGGAVILASNPVAGSTIVVHDASYYEDTLPLMSNNIPIILVNNKRRWDDLTVTAVQNTSPFRGLTTLASLTSPNSFPANKSEVLTIESVSYRWVDSSGADPDTNNDGVCDSAETTPFIPDCVIQRAEFITNNPGAVTPADTDWQVLGTNVLSLSLTYLKTDGTTASAAADIARIRIILQCRDRGMNIADVQNIRLQSEVVVRNQKFVLGE